MKAIIMKPELLNLRDIIDEQSRRCADFETDKAILKETIEILEKTTCVSRRALINKEKAIITSGLNQLTD